MERQKLLEFMHEGETSHDGGGDRQSSGPSVVSQAGTASIESTETADSPLLQEVLRESTLEQAWHQVRSRAGSIQLEATLARAIASKLNRRVRTRMPGGVGGDQPQGCIGSP